MAKFKRQYRKLLTRSIPLLTVQYWYAGEYFGLHNLTEKRVHFNPLFIHREGKGVDSYYETNNPETKDENLVKYFIENPKKFDDLMKKYDLECKRLIAISKKAKQKDFSKIFKMLVSYWATFDVINVLSSALGKNPGNRVLKKAYEQRKKWEKVEYISEKCIMNLAEKSFPDYKDYLYFLTFDELNKKNLPSKEELEKRKRGYIYFEGKVYTNINLEDLEKQEGIELVRPSQELKSDNLIKGTTAMKGKAIGSVKIILNPKDLYKIRQGDILVTVMTSPDYVPALKKVSAIITNEGGIMCHAAINARETNKPCIIGTQIATHVLRDNDLVEVNASQDQGTVKILKRN